MSITAPAGFTAGSQPHLTLIVNEGPLQEAAGVFTSNRVVAAPVVWSRAALADHHAHAVVANSACANACTGSQGDDDARATADHVAGLLGCGVDEVLVASTGIIGVPLDMDRITAWTDAAHADLATGPAADDAAARAIMTTDTVTKTATLTVGGVTFGGIAKGAGMLAPQLATMLVFLTTDAVVGPGELQPALAAATAVTFSRVDSDACMSTNDTVIALASGASGQSLSRSALTQALTSLCADLARQLVADAEGSHHDVLVEVEGATTTEAAEAVAREVARSNLVKTAIAGNDPNWGRILAAVGCVPEDVAPYRPDEVDVAINGVTICRAGAIGDDRELVDLTPREVHITIDLHAGHAHGHVWTNDLTHEYVEENSAYTS
ncbi:bifunctional glutamate N-acetyltransferase/amino-acid acetyltransferase ArgJ [Acidipropionibacterium timonense]|uniref:bifunctional glutamate N-acetyltransferase/amino-acid acetyltransferase ArgJ n=1 Tax=Acidipropionibacterium timonense TaxID=2161818 RepID=UPI001031BAF1|nr:bifunctional glutamate N-acetyltransferase/amino-acid acetyltransferase ArgJ [Acidipropionibacterium timonense]